MTFPRHFFVLRPFFFTRPRTQRCSYAIILSPYSAEKKSHHTTFRQLTVIRARTHTNARTQKPLGFIFNLQNDVEIESAATGGDARHSDFCPHTRFFYLYLYCEFLTYDLTDRRAFFLFSFRLYQLVVHAV